MHAIRPSIVIVFALVARAAPAASPLRGDLDGNGERNITDPIAILNFLFLGGAPPRCEPVADANADLVLNLTDPVFLLSHLFLSGEEPAELSVEEAAACGVPDPEAVLRGMKVYETPDPGGNFTACATCHEVIPDAESSFVRPGHTLVDALRRPSWKGGRLDRFIDAVNVCREDWMATSPWDDGDPEFADLVAFLESTSPAGPAPALAYEIDCDPRPGPAGDGPRGCALFNRSCAVCHGTGAVGNNFLAPSLVDPNAILLDDPAYIRTRIRRSGPSVEDRADVVYPCLTGATTMPFWSRDKLSDQDVEDLIAFVALARAERERGNETFDCTAPPPPPDGRVVRRGRFMNAAPQYGVSGFAEELDTRKVRLASFDYLGTGIVVKVWLFDEGRIREGTAIGPDLRRPVPYQDETVVVDIPPEHYDAEGRPLFDSVSIWCLAARVNFADARLEAP